MIKIAAVQNNISGTVRFLNLCSDGSEKKLQTLLQKNSSFFCVRFSWYFLHELFVRTTTDQLWTDPKGRINIRVYIWGRFYRRRRDKMTRTWFAQTFFISSVSVAPCYPLVCENPFKYKHKCKQIDHWFKQITFIFTIFGVIRFYLQSTLSVEN